MGQLYVHRRAVVLTAHCRACDIFVSSLFPRPEESVTRDFPFLHGEIRFAGALIAEKQGGKFMIKKTARKHTTHKKTAAHQGAKTRARRSPAAAAAAARTWRPTQDGPESQTLGDESALQAENSVRDESDAEAAADYGVTVKEAR